MRISVILSTYNAPEALERAVWGYEAQTFRDFELVVADDGSTDETRHLIERLQAENRLQIRHVWHQDEGFRKCRILNRATEVATGEYLVYSDGDCIPRDDFLAAHARLARPETFLSGGRLNVAPGVGDAIGRDDVIEGRAFDPGWLRSTGARRARGMLKLVAREPWAAWLDALTPTRATWNGHNSSAWKADVLAVNGYDERMKWGGEDRELGERLRNAGISGKQIRHRAVCVHIDHPREYVDRQGIRDNRELRRATRGVPEALSRFEGWTSGPTWTEHGILKGPRPTAAAASTGTG